LTLKDPLADARGSVSSWLLASISRRFLEVLDPIIVDPFFARGRRGIVNQLRASKAGKIEGPRPD
jgi:hypothetical protein